MIERKGHRRLKRYLTNLMQRRNLRSESEKFQGIYESKIRIETNSIRNLLDLKSRKWDKEKESSSVYSELHNSVKSILKCFEDEEYLVISSEGKGKQLRGDCFGNVSIGSRTFLLHSSIYRGKFR